MTQNIRFEEWEAEQMADPEFRVAIEKLEPGYQVTRLRLMRGLTQAQLAGLVGTSQSSIARLESGRAQPSLSFLRRVVTSLGGRLEVNILPGGAASTFAVTTGGPIRPDERLILVQDWPTTSKVLAAVDADNPDHSATHLERATQW